MTNNRKYQVCTKCVMDTSDSVIKFDENGVCDHCNNYEENIKEIWNNVLNSKKLNNLMMKIKRDGKNNEYDCIIGLSGGIDSSYVLDYTVNELKLRPFVLVVDTGWNLKVADLNISSLLEKLKVPYRKVTIDFDQMCDLQLSFFKSQVPYQDLPQDHIIFSTLYNTAVKMKIKHVLTGGNFSTEAIREPNEWVYQNDLRMIKDIHRKYGESKLDKLRMTGMFKYKLYYRFFKGMKVHRILDFIPYSKSIALERLTATYGFVPYENKHYESRFTRYYEGYWLIKKFGYDKRKAHFSSLILSGQLDRGKAMEILSNPPYDSNLVLEDESIICDELGITIEYFNELMKGANKTYKDYKNTSKFIKIAVFIARLLGVEKRQYR